ncbi:MAG: hypothetical protein ABI462_14870 [Ignavibacteria bacterium]
MHRDKKIDHNLSCEGIYYLRLKAILLKVGFGKKYYVAYFVNIEKTIVHTKFYL